MDIQLTDKQRMARTAMLLDLTQPMTKVEQEALLHNPYWEWPRSLKVKAGTMGLLVRNEDGMALGLPPDAPELQAGIPPPDQEQMELPLDQEAAPSPER